MKNINCSEFKKFKNSKGDTVQVCRKHYCHCLDIFPFDKELNENYQIAKRKGLAGNGIFYNK